MVQICSISKRQFKPLNCFEKHVHYVTPSRVIVGTNPSTISMNFYIYDMCFFLALTSHFHSEMSCQGQSELLAHDISILRKASDWPHISHFLWHRNREKSRKKPCISAHFSFLHWKCENSRKKPDQLTLNISLLPCLSFGLL